MARTPAICCHILSPVAVGYDLGIFYTKGVGLLVANGGDDGVSSTS